MESKLFENDQLYFYVEKSVIKRLGPALRTLINHSANIIKSLEFLKSKELRVKKLYCVLPDGEPELFKGIQ